MARKRRREPVPPPESRGRKAGKWVIGTVLAAVAALVTAAFAGAFNQVIDSRGVGDVVRDMFRPGDHLRITLLHMGHPSGGWAAVLPTGAASPVDEYSRPGSLSGIPPNGAKEARLNAGAFMLGGMVLQIEVEGLRNQQVTLFNVRPITTLEPMPLGDVIDIGSQGGDAMRMWFVLDEPSPRAKIVDETSPDGRPFFEEKRIGLGDGHKESLSLTLTAHRAAYSFDLAFDYEIGGTKYTQILRRDGHPFRVAASICAPKTLLGKVTDADRAKFATMRYRHVVRSDFSTVPYSLKIVPPDQYCALVNQ